MQNVAELLNDRDSKKLVFKCPGCRCSHCVNVKLNNAAQGPLWSWNGSLERPTLTPSILVEYGRDPRPDRPQRCHSFVTDGRIQFLSDCEHDFAGKTVNLESVEK